MNIKIINSDRLRKILLCIILILGLFLRIYKIDSVPTGFTWDEAAVGYNAFTIANYARDEYGQLLPLTFESFGEDKSPIHIYLTAIPIRILGLSEFSTRLMPALFGVLTILMFYLLLSEMFKNKNLGLIGAFLLSISPYSLQFSRFNHEFNFTLFFFMFGLWLWFIALKKYWVLPLSIICFSVSVFSYHSAKIVVPLTLLILIVIYAKDIWKHKITCLISMIILLCVGLIYITNDELLGISRMQQASLNKEYIQSTPIFKYIVSEQQIIPVSLAEPIARIQQSIIRYFAYFDPNYLFFQGDKNLRHSTQMVGEFFVIDAIFLVLGIIVLIKKRTKEAVVLLLTAMVAPIPGAISGGVDEIGHSSRGMFMLISWLAIIAVGLTSAIESVKNHKARILTTVVIFSIYGVLFYKYINDYYQYYPQRSAIEWQYGMKEIVSYVNDNPDLKLVYVTDVRAQPYIFFLFYLNYQLYDYMREIEINPTETRSHNNIYSFNKYHFGDWDQIQSVPTKGVLYVIEPSIYTGLAHKKDFEVKKLIKFPNGNDAFYLIEGIN